ncbi:hypothetical protein [Nocardioides sp. AX2bis]|uniref:hypothetical protein n=1 Tax=Nocardioides sp. AX2bis TaxID=2653157 RepID=UPI0012F11FD5|nr:hypothetical protein [Nocardioides sp. AX2bis]VXC11136.1 conserved hypothetical protein [Nocardioides sp. AX2bis]
MDPSKDTRAKRTDAHHRRAGLVKGAITAGALALVVVHLVWPTVQMDTIVLVLLGIAIVPWLGSVFESIDTPIGGVKYRELAQRMDQVEGASASVRQVQEANEARERAQLTDAIDGESRERLPSLVSQYNAVRDPRTGMPSGSARTQVMTKIVGEMIAAADAGESVPLESALKGGDLGQRLAAYAVLYSKPDPNYTIVLIDSVIDVEKKPFGQFWGLRAISRLAEEMGSQQIDRNSARRLRDLRKELPAASDRMFELRGILEVLDLS